MKEDPGFYDYWPYDNRPKISWPGGARLAFWVAPNIEFYELDPPANPHRKAWPQPYPAIPGYSIRDYGNRVGHARQMAVLDKYGMGLHPLSTALCDHHPEIIAVRTAGLGVFSHGIYNTRYTYGMSPEQERDMILTHAEHSPPHRPALRGLPRARPVAFRTHPGPVCRGRHSAGGPGRRLHTCDLFHDDQPTPIHTRSGKPFVSIPYSLEMNDTIAYVVNKIEPRRYGQMLRDNFDRLYRRERPRAR